MLRSWDWPCNNGKTLSNNFLSPSNSEKTMDPMFFFEATEIITFNPRTLEAMKRSPLWSLPLSSLYLPRKFNSEFAPGKMVVKEEDPIGYWVLVTLERGERLYFGRGMNINSCLFDLGGLPRKKGPIATKKRAFQVNLLTAKRTILQKTRDSTGIYTVCICATRTSISTWHI